MASIAITQENGGLSFVTSDGHLSLLMKSFAVRLEFETNIIIQSSDNNVHRQIEISYTKYDSVTLDGNAIANVNDLYDALKIISSEGTIQTSITDFAGQPPGTLFFDNISTTQRQPTLSGRWSQGIPASGFEISVNSTGYWKVVEDGAALNGAVEVATGTDNDGFFYVNTQRANRYQDGQLSYYLYTIGFIGIDTANEDFEVWTGAILRGLESDGQFDQIKEGFVFGYRWDAASGAAKPYSRVYKNFNVVHEDEIDPALLPVNKQNLHIYQIRVGYLGIHPFQLYLVDDSNATTKLVFNKMFEQDVTSVNDPDLAMAVFCKNKGNTTNVGVRNGSIQFGNYGNNRDTADSSARPAVASLELATISAGATIVATYTVPEKATMIKEVNLSGVITDDFRITQTNRLNNIQVSGICNKTARLKIYDVPKSAQTGATYTSINEGVNVIQEATGVNVGTVDLTDATLVKSFIFNSGNNPIPVDRSFKDEVLLLDNKTVSVLVVENTQTVTDYEHILDTSDLF